MGASCSFAVYGDVSRTRDLHSPTFLEAPMLLARQANGQSFPAAPVGPAPLPVLLYRRGALPTRGLEALESDHRVELITPRELSAEWVSFGRRAAACVLATSEDPFELLTYAIMAGLRDRVVMAIEQRHAGVSDDLLHAGAYACVTMPVSTADVSTLVSSLAEPAGSPLVAGGIRLVLDPLTRTIRHGDRSARLTQREFALLHCLVSHATPVSAEELLRTAWGDNPKVAGSRPVLEVYVHQVRKKLARVGLDRVLRTVRGFGYELGGASVA